MKRYIIENNGKDVLIPKDLIHKIIIDHYQKSYHMVFGFSGLIIGFLLAVIAIGGK